MFRFAIMKKYYLILWFTFIGIYLKGQTVSIGYGLFHTNQDVFKKGQHFQIDAGLRVSKFLTCSFNYSQGTSADIVNFYPMYRVYYSWFNTDVDTFYNVKETNKYSFRTYLFKARFYCNTKNRLNVFITPIFGLSKLTETKIFRSQLYNETDIYPVDAPLYISNGLEVGLEFPLNKRKNILLNVSSSYLYIFSNRPVTDVYNPSFTWFDTQYNSLQLNIRYEFSKKFTNPKDRKKCVTVL